MPINDTMPPNPDPHALDQATLARVRQVFQQARSGDADALEALLAQGLPPNLCNERGDSLLMLACYHGHPDAARVLLEHGADPALMNDAGQAPLHGAAFKGDLAVATLLLERNSRVIARLAVCTFVAAVVLSGIAGVARSSPDTPWLSWVDTQITGYTSRVVEGLSGEALSRDTSAQFRVEENWYLRRAVVEQPIVGHGLGYAYRPIIGPSTGYIASSGAYYAHNFYYWMLVKAGILGLIIFAAAVLPRFRRPASRPQNVWLACASALAGLLVGSFVAPFPLGVESGSAMLIGVLAGLMVNRSGSDDDARDRPVASAAQRNGGRKRPGDARRLEPAHHSRADG